MSYDATKPEDTGFLSEAPKELRTNFGGLKKDQIVDAALLKGLAPGNANGNIPVANGTECENLNAAKVNGKTASDFAPEKHPHDVATISSDGFMSAADKVKLNSIADNAEVNQNAFSNVLINGTTIQADNATDILELMAGANIKLMPDATNDRVTIAVSGKVPSAASADAVGIIQADAAGFNRVKGDLLFETKDASTWVRCEAKGASLYFYNHTNNEEMFRINVNDGICEIAGKQVVTIDQIPKTLPANGGDSDTVDGKHAADFALAATQSFTNIGEYTGDLNNLGGNTVCFVKLSSNQNTPSADYSYGTVITFGGGGIEGSWSQMYIPHAGAGQMWFRGGWGTDRRHWKQVSTTDMGIKIGIKSGVIYHGQQIPLPDGFEQWQCQWMVSPNQIWNDDHDNLHGYHIYCWADGNRWVTCYQHDWGYHGQGDRPGYANFMIIGVK